MQIRKRTLKWAALPLFILFALAMVLASTYSGSIIVPNVTQPNVTNGSFINYTSVYVKYNVSGELTYYDCDLYINRTRTSGSFISYNSTDNLANNTINTVGPVNLAEDYILWYVNCSNSSNASDSKVSGLMHFWIDQTAPNITVNEPANWTNYSTTSLTINFTITDNFDTGKRVNISVSNMSYGAFKANNQTWNAVANNTATGTAQTYDDGTWNFSITVYENASADLTGLTGDHYNYTTGVYWFMVDSTAPVVSTPNTILEYNDSHMNISINFNFSDANWNEDIGEFECGVRLYNASKSNVTDTARGSFSLNTSTNTTYIANCTVWLWSENVSQEGRFNLETYVTDSVGNRGVAANQTNYTKITLSAGWNLIQAQRTGTLLEMAAILGGNVSSAVSYVSKYSNVNKNYTTYTLGLTTNAAEHVDEGTPLYIYVANNATIMTKEDANVTDRQFALYSGWNQMTFYNRSGTSLEPWLNASNETHLGNAEKLTNYTNGGANVSNARTEYVSYHDWANQTYVPARYDLTINKKFPMPRGRGFWIYLNGTWGSASNYTNRANITIRRGY